MVTQKGGLEPLIKLPKFKYTFNEKRKIFIGYIYPYSEYFIKCVTSIPFNNYTYNSETKYTHIDESKEKILFVVMVIDVRYIYFQEEPFMNC